MPPVVQVVPRPGSGKLSFRRRGLLIGALLLAALALWSLFIGSRPIPAQVTWQALVAFDAGSSEHLLVRYLRIPRTLLAIVVGAALGVSGAIMQALTRNPLADPGILGVNAGAMVAIVAAIAFLGVSDVAGYMWFGLLGAGLVGCGVYFLSGGWREINPVRVVLAGAALTVVLLALAQLITVNSDEEVFNQFRHWVVGSLQGRGYAVLGPVSLVAAAGLLVSLTLAKSLDMVALGNDLGQSLGVNALWVWLLSALTIISLAGAATAAAGPIGFIGLTAPHFARFVAGSDHRWVLPWSMLISAILMVTADILGRLLGYPGEIGVGIMAALIGGPVFVVLVRRWKIIQL
ncbi:MULTISPECIES: FecCD family ABC transporter permease [Brenneria]|uniref:Iron ABC transporter permease n=1 Tax=Brenneria nigrifluens DSM 30175 = ATCC 13028 TaxID=1121120 RepID=A0A2U1UQT4_9GAMM|nr:MULTISPECIES: iron ABC transporter permease [Brenneria]EHD22198.1 ABC-type transporter, integral membrane subunit [Brenneria sp. EniD312]PWC24030.1 iron ABC transporter permease [Brenneria nigrifluens DSM 30175 = ATCC 13028]QCR05224.1 iron ABC transporter permease [Brenneria nigrifluens DSM 30175 = ATCC 13028]